MAVPRRRPPHLAAHAGDHVRRGVLGEAGERDGVEVFVAKVLLVQSGEALRLRDHAHGRDLEEEDLARVGELRLPAGHTAILFVRRGELAVGGEGGSKERVVGPQGVALMEREGEGLVTYHVILHYTVKYNQLAKNARSAARAFNFKLIHEL